MMNISAMDELDQELQQYNERARKREESSKYGQLFQMPKQKDQDGSIRCRIRFITPWKSPTVIKLHDKWQAEGFPLVCPTQLKKPCPYDSMTKDELTALKITDKNLFCWTVWNYAGGPEGKGRVEILAFFVNNASPVPGLHTMMQDKMQAALENGTPPSDWTDFDVVLVQHGEQRLRTFDVLSRDKAPFKGPTGLAPYTPEQILLTVTWVKSNHLIDRVDDDGGTSNNKKQPVKTPAAHIPDNEFDL